MENAKQRHGFFLAWLILSTIGNTLVAFSYTFRSADIMQAIPTATSGALFLLTICSVANIVSAFALYRWKKWGFYGFCASAALATIVNIVIGLGIGPLFLGLLGIPILYGIMHVGGQSKAWPQMS